MLYTNNNINCLPSETEQNRHRYIHAPLSVKVKPILYNPGFDVVQYSDNLKYNVK